MEGIEIDYKDPNREIKNILLTEIKIAKENYSTETIPGRKLIFEATIQNLKIAYNLIEDYEKANNNKPIRKIGITNKK